MSLAAMSLFACLAPLAAQTAGDSASAVRYPVTDQMGEAEACVDGRISSIDIESNSIFDPGATNTRALQWTYRFINLLHIRTSPTFIRGELLFVRGDCYDPFLVSESERLLAGYGFLADADIVAEREPDGNHRVRVATRDEWSTQVDVGATYDEGANLEKLQITEQNFLGRGIFGEFTHLDRLESKTQAFGVSTPRFFGRADAGIAWGHSRSGHFFRQHLRYPFVGDAGSISLREGFDRTTDFFAYSTDGAEAFSRVLVPVTRERLELSTARRFGPPGGSLMLGFSFLRDASRFRKDAELTYGDNYDDRVILVGDPPPPIQRQMAEHTATRLALHIGTRRFIYREYVGLDGVRDHQDVGIGIFAGVSVAKSLPLFSSADIPMLDDIVTRGHASFTAALGSSILIGGTTVEGRHEDSRWRDVLADADLGFYGRTSAIPWQTLFLRASVAGGWSTSLPYQLSLGGRETVRSLLEDQFPGGRQALFVIEDRIVLPWPRARVADLGATVFSDIGRVWPGDVPYGVDSGWQASVGFGLRLGIPSGTRNIIRADVVFPVGQTQGDPVFRVTFEFNRLRSGFYTRELFRSRWFNLGPDFF